MSRRSDEHFTYNVNFSVQTITDKAICRYIHGDSAFTSALLQNSKCLDNDEKDLL
jgi:hypothetical protein